ncbi:uncharacterized protein LOC131665848 [Phymastichus coffea]|uniref:uncharacterized protein LOC131665848 n=1 Tax=Phymastichus coffea TaxID=108790 RepID=UPI00273B91AC|nr:uncharacterized protein LOC131665848 [Phymastichus coffea]
MIMADDELEDDRASSRRKSSLASGLGSQASTCKGGEGGGEGGVLAGVLPKAEVQSLMEKAKFYTSLCLGTTSILAVFAFLFAVPFIVEPAISTILADFSPKPVACATTSHVLAEGLKNCSWASCREGCTAAVTSCHQIRVNYTKLTYEEFVSKPTGSVPWDVVETKFYVNAEGCGYPDTGVICSQFARKYGDMTPGKVFPCYYSRTYPETVVSKYSWDDNLRNLILALTIPVLLFILPLAMLCYWYCPPVNKTCGGTKRGLIDEYDRKEDILGEEDFEQDEVEEDFEEEY